MNFTLKIFVVVLTLFAVNDIMQILTMTGAQRIYSPLTLIRKQQQYLFPYNLSVNSDNEIEYMLEADEEIVNFCPPSEPWQIKRAEKFIDGQCLFKHSGADQKCETSPEPFIYLMSDSDESDICDKNRTAYAYTYRLCFSDESEKVNESSADSYLQILYTFCYTRYSSSFIYLSYRILSPHLLTIDRLRERENAQVDTNIKTYLDSEHTLENSIDHMSRWFPFQDNLKKAIQNITDRSLTKLAPVDDMALALWKMPFFHIVNHGILFNRFIEQWDRINEFLRGTAIQKRSALRIVVGICEEDCGIARAWWKIVFNEDETRAMGIILQNLSLSQRPSTPPMCDAGSVISCYSYGFQGMILEETAPYVSCCEPKNIAQKIALKVYDSLEVLDLNTP